MFQACRSAPVAGHGLGSIFGSSRATAVGSCYIDRQPGRSAMMVPMAEDDQLARAGRAGAEGMDTSAQPRVASARKGVDPTALLIAVFVVVSGEVSSPGLWDLLDMIVALVVLVLILAYSLPAAFQQSRFQRVALSLVVGFVFAVAISLPLQWLFVVPHWRAASDDATADRATLIGLMFLGLPLAFGIIFRFGARIRQMWMLTSQAVRRLIGGLHPPPSDP